jgi:hypothetical protein
MSSSFAHSKSQSQIVCAAACLLVVAFASRATADMHVAFDIPDTIECRDVTPAKCAEAHPMLKVIEGKFRLSARLTRGSETEIYDFLYMLVSPGLRLKIHDYLPNTTLESALADDNIEVAETTENAAASSEEAHVAYKILQLGGSKNQSSKKTESNHYKQIVPKALVLASGTTNREHGVFFKLRPSNGASLEGAKEFTFLAVVPKDWRGDWVTLACAARAKKKSFVPGSMPVAGIAQAHVGLYLSGDREAGTLAEELSRVQETNATQLSKSLAAEAQQLLDSMHEAALPKPHLPHYDDLLRVSFLSRGANEDTERAKASMAKVQDRLSQLSGAAR